MPKQKKSGLNEQVFTVSSRVYAQLWTAHIPRFGSEVIFRSGVTQCESCTCIGIMPTPTSILMWLETLRAYMHKDTVFHTGSL